MNACPSHITVKNAWKYNTLVSPSLLPFLLPLARGYYQRDLLRGDARWSGADLCGNAKKWGASYARSRANLLQRIEKKGFVVTEIRGPKNRRIVKIEAPLLLAPVPEGEIP